MGEDTVVPTSHTMNDLTVEQVTCEEAKRGREILEEQRQPQSQKGLSFLQSYHRGIPHKMRKDEKHLEAPSLEMLTE